MKIKDIVKLVTKSVSPLEGTDYHLYSLPSFDEGKMPEFIDGKDIQSNKFEVPEKCILFNKLNVRFKRVWRVYNQDNNKLCSTEFLPLLVDEEKVDFQYCYYLLISDEITNYLCGQNSNTSGSHKRINPIDFMNIDIKLPKMSDQKRIGQTLATLDRKIELNRQINDNLEAMAKQLYDYWFVQFDFPNEEGKPYKSSGGAMVYNEKLKREIPKGWHVLSVNDIAANVRGVSYAKEDMVDSNNGVLVLRGNNIQDNHLIYDSNVAYIPSSFVSEDQRIRPLDIIMTMSSGSKEHIGKSAMFQFASEDTFGAFLTKFTAKEHCAYLLFNLFNSQYFKTKIKSIACGTGINNLTNLTFDEIYIVMPEDKLLLEFDKRQSQIFAEIGLIEKSNVELTKQRDELLPLLMNGQATINYHLSDD